MSDLYQTSSGSEGAQPGGSGSHQNAAPLSADEEATLGGGGGNSGCGGGGGGGGDGGGGGSGGGGGDGSGSGDGGAEKC